MDILGLFLDLLRDPTIAYILLILGLSLGLFELAGPGHLVPGLVGGALTLLSLFLFSTLPVNFLGVLIVIIGFALLAGEVLQPGFGVFGVSGLAALVVGSLILAGPWAAVAAVSPLAVGILLLITAGYFLVAIRGIVRSRRHYVTTGREGLVHATGLARTDLKPQGYVLIEGELWQAISPLGTIRAGEHVRVLSMEGFRLVVFSVEDLV
ncbi:MAG: hypothetical protein M0Z94_08550 [Dehalococcoidales bacterium]|nr:hypothetical protein [Dehalococcoidales bacterium]